MEDYNYENRKKNTAVAVAAATVAMLSVAATAYSDYATGSAGAYGTLSGQTAVLQSGSSTIFTIYTRTSQAAPQLRAAIRVTNTRNNVIAYNNEGSPVIAYDTTATSCQSPGLSQSSPYSSFSTNAVYGGNGKIINYVNTVGDNNDMR